MEVWLLLSFFAALSMLVINNFYPFASDLNVKRFFLIFFSYMLLVFALIYGASFSDYTSGIYQNYKMRNSVLTLLGMFGLYIWILGLVEFTLEWKWENLARKFFENLLYLFLILDVPRLIDEKNFFWGLCVSIVIILRAFYLCRFFLKRTREV